VELAEVKPSDEVLDAACGTGDLSLLFAQSEAHRVVGVDFTEAMLEIARAKALALAARDLLDAAKIEFAHTDITQLRIEDGSFDIVSIAFGLRNVEKPELALQEMRRVLRPGGRLLILEFSRPRNPLARVVNQVYSRHIMPLTASLIARDRSGAYRYLPRSIEKFPDGEELKGVVRDAGFAQTQQHVLTFGICAITIGRV
jgi:demethylmenaquinone methyltransferase/2-methoxy-6-polyprenyl-1,4-benzoquinol methylase